MINVLDSSLSMENNITFVESYKDGNKVSKLFYFMLSLFHFTLCLLIKDVDIVHINSSSGGSFQRKKIFCMICKFFNVKYIVHIHSGAFIDFYVSLSNKSKLEMESVLNKSAAVIAISNHFYLALKDLFPAANVQLIPNATTIQAPKHVDVESKFKNRVILYMGRISKDKGFLDACKIYNKLLKENESDIRFIVAGIADSPTIYKSEEFLAIREKIELRGWVSGDELLDLLSQATVVVCPSYFEAFGLTALEASIFSTPVFAYDVGGLTDVILHCKTGEVAEKGDYKGLAYGIQRIMNDESEYEKYSLNAFDHSSSSFSQIKYAQQVESLFNSILKA